MAIFLQEYHKLKHLGRGSFASVYKVRHAELGYIRAIKVSNEIIEDQDDPAYKTFINECKVLLKIGNGCHPNIVRIYQPRLIDNKALVEMDYIDGITLSQYLQTNHFIAIDEFWEFAFQVVGALAYCHADLYRFLMDPEEDNLETDPEDGSKYLIDAAKEAQLKAKYCVNHNDLHSNNIMRRDYDGAFILLDFGLAIQDHHCVKSSSRGDGAYEYCSPEKLEGKEITSAGDVYSLGILLYEMLAGRVPFVMDTNSQALEMARFDVYNKHLNELPPSISQFREEAYHAAHPESTYQRDFSVGLENIIMKCLAKNPDERYHDAKELLEALKDEYESLHPQSSRPPRLSEDDKKYLHQISQLNEQLESTRGDLIESNRKLNEINKTSHSNEAALRQKIQTLQYEVQSLKSQAHYSANATSHTKLPLSFRILWIFSFILFAGMLSWGVQQFITTDYFIKTDALPDMIMLGSGVLGLVGMLAVRIYPKAHAIIWSLITIFVIASGSLTFISRLEYGLYLGVLAGVSLILFIAAWICNPTDTNNA